MECYKNVQSLNLKGQEITVPETCYIPTWTVSERWTHSKRTVSALWAYGERTLNVFGEKLMNGERWANAVRKVNDERTVNAMCTLCERKMNALIRVPWGYPNIVFRR